VTEVPAIPGDSSGTVGPGRLVLVVGPSGAGKDTLIGLARAVLAGDGNVVFPRRLVTRQASPSEDNEYSAPEAFQLALSRGDLAVHWEAHGHCYGLPGSIVDDIRAGRTVVVNVSRTMVEAMRGTYANVVVVAVTAPLEVLAERLAARSRGSDGRIADRLGRVVAGPAATPDVTIVNVGRAEDHARELLQAIKAILKPLD
jgi:ribose 1,5-bisphosphokinase